MSRVCPHGRAERRFASYVHPPTPPLLALTSKRCALPVRGGTPHWSAAFSTCSTATYLRPPRPRNVQSGKDFGCENGKAPGPGPEAFKGKKNGRKLSQEGGNLQRGTFRPLYR